mmetsp:Transcript_86336/g.244902  ORF Transcript_86336/g.244902 Transcript_86336/m.244902 type:complete len:275 (-) Transcript_86336:37-861(-)
MSSVLEELNSLPEDQATEAIIEALRHRPELAPAVVAACCPDLTYAPAKSATDRRENGYIKSFNQKNGYGFVESPGLFEIFGQDVFLHRRQMGAFMVGQQVSFAVMLNDDNKPQAFDLQPLGGHHLPPPGYHPADMGYHPADMAGHWGPPPPPPRSDPADPRGRRFRGTLKSFNPSSGFGFVECRETRDLFGRDVFVHRDEVRDTPAGARVSFSVVLNGKGQPQAKAMRVIDGGFGAGDGAWQRGARSSGGPRRMHASSGTKAGCGGVKRPRPSM